VTIIHYFKLFNFYFCDASTCAMMVCDVSKTLLCSHDLLCIQSCDSFVLLHW